MKTQNLQNNLDVLINKYFLVLIPKKIRPNYFTFLRIALVPIIYLLLSIGYIKSALILFIFAASTDFIDGALARTRDQITELGKVLDPIADKMLIAVILIFIGFEYLIVKIFVIFIASEIIAILASVLMSYKIGRPIGSNIFGKLKMILQCLAVFIFLVGLISKNNYLIELSEAILFVALLFALLSALKQIQLKLPKILKNI